MLDWLVVIAIDAKVATRVEHWCGMFPNWTKTLRVWDEAGVVKIKTYDLCMYYKWNLAVPAESKAFTNRFECDNVGEVNEYVGCKIKRDEKDNSFTFNQPVLIQSFNDEFELSNKHPKTPAMAGTTL
eukprot:9750053-Ditylum_brightwellii.AAC.1